MTTIHRTRYEVWGRWLLGGREELICRLDPHEVYGNRVAKMQEEFGDHWNLWVEAFPIIHPAKRRGRPPNDLTLAEVKIQPEEREHIYDIAPS